MRSELRSNHRSACTQPPSPVVERIPDPPRDLRLQILQRRSRSRVPLNAGVCPTRPDGDTLTLAIMSPDLLKRITVEPGKCGGRPCIRGMRIRVQDILEFLGAGASHAEILEDYPYLEEEDIQAALAYAAC